MKHFLFVLMLMFVAVARAAVWAPPATAQGWWTAWTDASTPGIGVPGGAEQYLAGKVNDRAVTGNVIDVTASPHNADKTGVLDTSAAIWSAITAASPGDVVYLPAGRYKLTNRLGLTYANKNDITIRGAGPALTTLYMSMAGTQGVFWTNDGGYIVSESQTITGTKTANTSVLTVASAANFTEGQIAWVFYENEVNNARIIAGAPPVWTSLGWPEARKQTVRVMAKTATTITIDPALTGDATNLGLRIVHYGYPATKLVGWGFEDFSIEFDAAAHPAQAFNIAAAQYCWFSNIKASNFSTNTGNSSWIKIADSYRCEVLKCDLRSLPKTSGDGLIETAGLSSVLFWDNVFVGPFQYHLYDSGNTNNSGYAYNYSSDNVAGFHNAHPTRNIIEGNYGYLSQVDAYHGSSSDFVYYSNAFYGGGTGGSGWFSLWIGSFNRRTVVARNLFGKDGQTSARIGWGFKNYNTNAIGFAGPTGLSDQVGQPVYNQPGYGPYEYIIQAGDVASGDFWADWETTGTLTTRVSDTVGVITVSGGRWLTGADLYPRIWWNNKQSGVGAIGVSSVTAVSGNQVTMSFPGGVLPPQGTSLQVYNGAGGYQELDLDVQASATVVHNRFGNASGTGSIQNSSGDTFPVSLIWSSKPTAFGNKPWPVFDADNVATQDPARLPAGHRFLNNNEDYLGGAATPQFSPAPGAYATAQTVTITTDSAAPYAIFYTIDGTTPTASSLVYSTPVTLPGSTTTLKAITIKSGLADSSVQSGTYTIASVPTAPSFLGATVVSSTQINLAWADNSSNETGFRIERRIGSGGWSTVATTAANVITYSNTGLTPSITYDFRVFAVNGSGDSTASNTATATTASVGGGNGTGTIQTLNVGTLNIQ
jgi:hypothetical protein